VTSGTGLALMPNTDAGLTQLNTLEKADAKLTFSDIPVFTSLFFHHQQYGREGVFFSRIHKSMCVWT
jgi:hypothetical protein